MSRQAIIELHYLPSIAFFSAISDCSEIVVEKFEHYEKQTYRNRCYILNSQGATALIVPLTEKHGKIAMGEVKIDYTQKWLNTHWRAIQTAYGKAPFFEYYNDELHETLFRRPTYLFELNHSLLTLCLKWMKWKLPISESLTFEKSVPGGITDLRSAITPKKRNRLNEFYQPVVYHQVFGRKFVPNLSILDLIMCEGPGARNIINASSPK